MNRGLLISLIVLTVTAVVAVLFFPSGNLEPLGPESNSSEIDPTEQQQVGQATFDAGANRVASENNEAGFENDEANPDAVVGRVRRSQDGKGLPYAKLVYAHRQFGGSEIGWSSDAIKAIGVHCDAKGRFVMPPDNRRADLAIVAWAPGYSVLRLAGLAVGDVVDFVLEPLVTVPGIVFDPDGLPAAGVPVELFDPSNAMDGFPSKGVTDAKGEFSIKANVASSAGIRILSGAGAAFQKLGIEIRNGMKPIRIDLSGSVSLLATLNDDMGRPIPGAALSLSKEGERRILGVMANQVGVAKVFGLDSGNWQVKIEAEGFALQEEQFNLAANGQVQHTWVLRRFSSLRVLVTDGKTRPLEGALIQLLPDPAGLDRHTRFELIPTDSEGIAIFTSVAPGRYVVAPESTPGMSPSALFEEDGPVGGKGAAHFSLMVDVASDAETEVNLVWKRHGVLNVQVLRNGDPVSGAKATLWKVGTMPMKSRDAKTLSDLQGMVEFPAVWMGKYELEVQGSPNEMSIRQQLDCGRGTNSFTIELPTGTISGTVKDEAGPIANAALWVGDAKNKPRKMAATDAQGNFEMSGFDLGQYHLRIEAEDHFNWEQKELAHDGSAVHFGVIELETTYRISGKVSGLKKQASDFFGPMVSVTDALGENLRTLPIHSDGTFAIDGIPRGTVTLQVLQGGKAVHSESVKVPLKDGILRIDL